MKITDLLDPRSISLDAAPTSKSETLDKAVELMAASGKLSDVEAFRKQVYAREEESTTGIGEGIAIPHGKCDAVTKPGLAAMVVKDGVEFDGHQKWRGFRLPGRRTGHSAVPDCSAKYKR